MAQAEYSTARLSQMRLSRSTFQDTKEEVEGSARGVRPGFPRSSQIRSEVQQSLAASKAARPRAQQQARDSFRRLQSTCANVSAECRRAFYPRHQPIRPHPCDSATPARGHFRHSPGRRLRDLRRAQLKRATILQLAAARHTPSKIKSGFPLLAFRTRLREP
jgi:hypothetical protein